MSCQIVIGPQFQDLTLKCCFLPCRRDYMHYAVNQVYFLSPLPKNRGIWPCVTVFIFQKLQGQMNTKKSKKTLPPRAGLKP